MCPRSSTATAWSPGATTAGPVRFIYCGRITTWRRAGVGSTRPPSTPLSSAPPRAPRRTLHHGPQASHRIPVPQSRRFLRRADRPPPRLDGGAERDTQRQAHPPARGPHRRPRRDQRGAPGGARGHVTVLSSLCPRKRASIAPPEPWIPACAGMTQEKFGLPSVLQRLSHLDVALGGPDARMGDAARLVVDAP